MSYYEQLRKQQFRDKYYNFKWKVKRTFENAINWIYRNKEIVILVGPTLIGGSTWLIKHFAKSRNLKKQENIKNLYCYDRSLGHYWKLRRELTNDEWTYIDKRKASGERLADILNELKVLK